MRDRHRQAEISVVETIGGHGRWSSDKGPEFLSNLALIYKFCPMGGGGVVEVYLQNQYTTTRKNEVLA